MTDHDMRNPQFLDPATMAAWHDLELRLDQVLIAMDDEEDGDHLVVQLEGHLTPYVQFASTNSGNHLRVELSGNAHLAEAWRLTPDQCAQLSADGWEGNTEDEPNWFRYVLTDEAPYLTNNLVGLLAQGFGIPHPHLLTQHSFGPFTLAMDVSATLGLTAISDVPEDPAGQWLDVDVVATADRDDLVFEVARMLEKICGEPVQVDADGDFVIDVGPRRFWARVHAAPLAVELFAVVIHNVHSRRATAVEIGLLNRDHSFIRWTLHDRQVMQRAMILGSPIAAAHLEQAVAAFVSALGNTADLALRTGGQVA